MTRVSKNLIRTTDKLVKQLSKFDSRRVRKAFKPRNGRTALKSVRFGISSKGLKRNRLEFLKRNWRTPAKE